MKTEIRKFVAAVSTLGLLASCAETGAPDVNNDMSMVGQDTGTFADNDSIERWYESTAEELAKHLSGSCGRCCLARRQTMQAVGSSVFPPFLVAFRGSVQAT
jgi:hypothetical protein